MPKYFTYYRVSISSNQAGHQGYSFHTSKGDAERFHDKWKKDTEATGDEVWRSAIEPIQVEATKKGILAALITLAGHADNG